MHSQGDACKVATETFGGRIDVLVNNALAKYAFNPASEQASIKTVNWEHFDEQFKGTVAGAVNAVKAVLPAMEEQGYGKVSPFLIAGDDFDCSYFKSACSPICL